MGEAELTALIQMVGLSEFSSGMNQAHGLFESLGEVAQSVMSSVESAMERGIQAFVSFGQTAVQEAAKVEQWKLTLGGLFNDLPMGNKLVDFYRQQAKDLSIASDTYLAAGVKMNAAGLNFGHFGEQISTFGKIAGGKDSDYMMFADAYARIKAGGNMGLAMRPFRKVGVGYDDLRHHGIPVSAGNRIDATPTKMFKALDEIYEEKGFGRIAEALKKSMNVTFVALQDSWNILLENFGKAFFPVITSVIKPLGQFIDFLSSSGEIEKIGKGFADAFGSVFGAAGGGNAVIGFLTYLMTSMEMLPGIIQAVGTVMVKAMAGIFGFVDKVFVNLVNAANEWFVGLFNNFNAINNAMEAQFKTWYLAAVRISQLLGFNKGINTDVDPWKETFAAHPDIVQKRLQPGDMGGALASVLQQLGGGGLLNVGKDFHSRQQAMMRAYEDYIKNPPKKLTNPAGDGYYNPGHTEDALDKIERNTAHVAAHMTDFKRYALGGGDYAEKGISLASFYGSAGPVHAPNRVQIDVRSGNGKMDEALSDMFMSFQQQYHRQTGRRH